MKGEMICGFGFISLKVSNAERGNSKILPIYASSQKFLTFIELGQNCDNQWLINMSFDHVPKDKKVEVCSFLNI